MQKQSGFDMHEMLFIFARPELPKSNYKDNHGQCRKFSMALGLCLSRLSLKFRFHSSITEWIELARTALREMERKRYHDLTPSTLSSLNWGLWPPFLKSLSGRFFKSSFPVSMPLAIGLHSNQHCGIEFELSKHLRPYIPMRLNRERTLLKKAGDVNANVNCQGDNDILCASLLFVFIARPPKHTPAGTSTMLRDCRLD